MTTVYKDEDLLNVYKQRQKLLYVFLGVTAGYLAFCVAWLVYHISLPYKDPMQKLPQAMVYVITAVYVAFLFPFMGIKYSRVNRYYKALINFSNGLKNEEKCYFYSFEEHLLQKDNIDVAYCVFETWSRKKQEWLERIAYFDTEKPLPDFKNGDFVQYIVQSNFIVQYDVIKRGAIEFELEEETGFTEE